MQQLSISRECFMNDHFHKIALDIVKWCLEHRIGTLVYGHNKGINQAVDIGHVNNQSFGQIPFGKLQSMLAYLCGRHGILLLIREESYTSKASFLDDDPIPTYGEIDAVPVFSGKRIKRGLYRSSDGTVLNADINAAANILRKQFPNAFDGVDKHSLLHLEFVRYDDLYTKRIPVKRIAAA